MVTFEETTVELKPTIYHNKTLFQLLQVLRRLYCTDKNHVSERRV